jgi:hypothetical protein
MGIEPHDALLAKQIWGALPDDVLGHMMPHDVNVDAAHHWPAGVQPFVTTRDGSVALFDPETA